MVHIRLGLVALAAVVSFGIGFLLWTLYHLLSESRPPSNRPTQPIPQNRLRRS